MASFILPSIFLFTFSSSRITCNTSSVSVRWASKNSFNTFLLLSCKIVSKSAERHILDFSLKRARGGTKSVGTFTAATSWAALLPKIPAIPEAPIVPITTTSAL